MIDRGHTPVEGLKSSSMRLSGRLRYLSVRLKKNRMVRFMALSLANTVNAVECTVDDIRHAKLPALWSELKLKTESKHPPLAVIRKAAVIVGIFGLATAYYLANRKNKHEAQVP